MTNIHHICIPKDFGGQTQILIILFTAKDNIISRAIQLRCANPPFKEEWLVLAEDRPFDRKKINIIK